MDVGILDLKHFSLQLYANIGELVHLAKDRFECVERKIGRANITRAISRVTMQGICFLHVASHVVGQLGESVGGLQRRVERICEAGCFHYVLERSCVAPVPHGELYDMRKLPKRFAQIIESEGDVDLGVRQLLTSFIRLLPQEKKDSRATGNQDGANAADRLNPSRPYLSSLLVYRDEHRIESNNESAGYAGQDANGKPESVSHADLSHLTSGVFDHAIVCGGMT